MATIARPELGWKTIPGTSLSEPVFLNLNAFSRIGREWMLITAGTAQDWNTMTASWGGLGVLWNKNVAFCFVRPTRHTWSFMERESRFTLSFFAEEYRGALEFCGARSGRDTDKASGAGLDPIVFDDGALSFAQAKEVLVCRKLYSQDFDPTLFKDPGIEANYPKKDYHRMYIGEIESVRSPC